MKQYMQIVGAEILDNTTMELTLIPISTVKEKKPDLVDLAAGGLDSILTALTSNKQYKSKMHLPIEKWGSMHLVVGAHITVELLRDTTTGGPK